MSTAVPDVYKPATWRPGMGMAWQAAALISQTLFSSLAHLSQSEMHRLVRS